VYYWKFHEKNKVCRKDNEEVARTCILYSFTMSHNNFAGNPSFLSA